MEKQWEEFTQKNVGNADFVRVSLNPRGVFGLNQKAVGLLGAPEAVVMLFDKANRLIGLKASSPDVNHAYELKQQGTSQNYFLRAKSFCNFYGIDTADTVVFNDVQMEDGVIVLQLGNVTEAARRARTIKFPDEEYGQLRKRAQTSIFSTLLRTKVPGYE